MQTDKVEFVADPISGGRLTPRALIGSQGTISLPFVPKMMEGQETIAIARLAGFGWFFNIGYHHGSLVVQRNGGQIRLTEAWCRGKNLPGSALVSWTQNELMVSFGTQLTHWNYPQCVEKCEWLQPPKELLKWVEREELSPASAFKNEQKFCIRVHSALQRFDERIRPIVNSDIFWDFVRKGNRIVSRRPKREIELQSLIHMTLVDHMQLSNISVTPEVRSAAGALDFLFTGIDESYNQLKMCAEFKYAHSAKFAQGLSEQLRAYMMSMSVENGAYCVFDFRGPYFDQPAQSSRELTDILVAEDLPFVRQGLKPIKVHWWRLYPES